MWTFKIQFLQKLRINLSQFLGWMTSSSSINNSDILLVHVLTTLSDLTLEGWWYDVMEFHFSCSTPFINIILLQNFHLSVWSHNWRAWYDVTCDEDKRSSSLILIVFQLFSFQTNINIDIFIKVLFEACNIASLVFTYSPRQMVSTSLSPEPETEKLCSVTR